MLLACVLDFRDPLFDETQMRHVTPQLRSGWDLSFTGVHRVPTRSGSSLGVGVPDSSDWLKRIGVSIGGRTARLVSH